MEESNKKRFNERAMYYGTLFGVIMIFTNILYLIGLKWAPASYLFLSTIAASPIIAGHLTINFRKKECGNKLTFANAWLFLMIMYLCGAILTAVAQFIYFATIDNGYLMQTMQQAYTDTLQIEGLDPALSKQLEAMLETMSTLTPRDIVLNILSSNIMLSPIITVIIAIFVKKR